MHNFLICFIKFKKLINFELNIFTYTILFFPPFFLLQRLGRAGRCQPGEYIALFSEKRCEYMPITTTPQLQSSDLESTLLRLRALGFTEPFVKILNEAPDPPLESAVYASAKSLTKLGGLNQNEQLTTLGLIMADIPMPALLSRMLVWASILGCLDPILKIAVAMTGGNSIFIEHKDGIETTELMRRQQKRNWNAISSDHFSDLHVINAFMAKGRGEQEEFARQHGLKAQILRRRILDANAILGQLSERGFAEYSSAETDIEFISSALGGVNANRNAHNLTLVRSLLAASLYPNICTFVQPGVYRTFDGIRVELLQRSVNYYGRKEDTIPPTLLSFYDHGRDGLNGIKAGNSTIADPIGLILFTPGVSVSYRGPQSGSSSDKGEIYVDNFSFIVEREADAMFLLELRKKIHQYVDLCIQSGRTRNHKDKLILELQQPLDNMICTLKSFMEK